MRHIKRRNMISNRMQETREPYRRERNRRSKFGTIDANTNLIEKGREIDREK